MKILTLVRRFISIIFSFQNPVLVLSFLKLCLSFCHLKLLNIKYSNTKLKVTDYELLPFLNKEKWLTFTSKLQEEEANLVWVRLQLYYKVYLSLWINTFSILIKKLIIIPKYETISIGFAMESVHIFRSMK